MTCEDVKMDTQRTYGVEIEFRGDLYRTVDALRAEGIAVEYEGYNHTTRSHWKIVTDCSVSATRVPEPDNSRGLELVSPPLRGEDGLWQIAHACNALKNAGAVVNKTCGLHVHHDVRDFDGKRLIDLIRLYQRAERVIDELHPKSRRGNECNYARSMLGITLPTDFRGTTDAAVQRVHLEVGEFGTGMGRRAKLNVLAYRVHGTVEFRQAAGTIEAQKIIHWIVVTQAMVTKAQGGKLKANAAPLPNWERVKQTLSLTTYWGGTQTEHDAARFFDARRAELSGAQ